MLLIRVCVIQESELDSPDLAVMLTGTAQQSQQPTPPASGPVPVAPIPTQTFTNQNFASVSTPQQVWLPLLFITDKKMLKRRRESDTYLTHICRHRWRAERARWK